MDRKAWIAITLSVIGLIASQWYYVEQQRTWRAQHPTPITAKASPSAIPAVSASPTPNAAATLEKTTPAPSLPIETRKLRTSVAEYTFTTAGGIQQIELLYHKAENGKNIILNDTNAIPIGAFTEDTGVWTNPAVFTNKSDSGISLESTTASGLKITKTFTIAPAAQSKDEFQARIDISFNNPQASRQEIKPWFLSTGGAVPIHQSDQARYTGFDYQVQAKTVYINVLGPFEPSRIPLVGIQLSQGKVEYRQAEQNILWAAAKNQYYTSILEPLGTKGISVWATRYLLPNVVPDAPKHYGITGALGFPGFGLNPGETRVESFAFYSGPKEYSRLKKLGVEQHEVMEFGFFKFFSEILLNSMNWLHSVLKSYAAAIIVLTLIIKTGLWTIQNKSMQSMKKMSLLAPKMNELKEKYKDDPTRMNQEVMKLYKDYGINPFSGCLPIFIQMPIFFGFYSMLAVAVELRNSSFLWVNDLSQPDTIARLPDSWPVIGHFPINLLPIVMAFSMLWQMRLTPKTGDTAQQRMFMFMPVIFLTFSYNYASALALYWTVQNIFSIVQLYLTRNQPLPQLVKVNAAPAGAKKIR